MMTIIEIKGGPITVRYLMNKTKYELAYMIMDEIPHIATLEQQLADMTREREELAAHCERLREAVQQMKHPVLDYLMEPLDCRVDELLAETPPASLAAHDAQIWKEAAAVCRDRAKVLRAAGDEIEARECISCARELEAKAKAKELEALK